MNGLTIGYLSAIHRDLGHSCEINGDRQYVKVEPHDGESPTLVSYGRNPPCEPERRTLKYAFGRKKGLPVNYAEPNQKIWDFIAQFHPSLLDLSDL